ncbi:MAG: putative GNAT family acetyltransferase [Paraglaciecola sp.]
MRPPKTSKLPTLRRQPNQIEFLMSENTDQVVNNPEKYRFEVASGALISVLEYRLGRTTIALVHSEVPEELQDQGIGSSLVVAALHHAREKELKVLPSCPFVAAYISRHEEEWADIVGEV